MFSTLANFAMTDARELSKQDPTAAIVPQPVLLHTQQTAPTQTSGTAQQQPPAYRAPDEEQDATVFNVKPYNILVLGESRSGKTTFRKVLKNINHKTKLEVFRGTPQPISRCMLVNIGGKYISINMLDTPGFGEASKGANRTDDSIRNMIVEFVKRDITRIDLILIAINGVSGITANQVSNITTVLKFLGRQVASRTCLLITHFENRPAADEKKWIDEFAGNPNMQFLMMACRGGFLFTGALDENQFQNVALRDSFIVQQKRRNIDFYRKVMSGESVSMLSEEMKNAKCMFALQESVLTSCMSLRQLIPDVIATGQHAMDLRIKISAAIAGGTIKDPALLKRAEEVVATLGDLGAEGKDMRNLHLDDGVVEMMRQYEEIGHQVQERYVRALQMNNEFSVKDQAASLVWNQIDWLS